MSQFVGCADKFTQQKNKEILDKVSDFITMFPSNNLNFLYDKDGNPSNLEEGDLGTWIVSSFNHSTVEKGWQTTGVTINFNKNTREAKGNFLKTIHDTNDINKIIEKAEYPIYYDKDGIKFVDQTIESSVKEELAKFKMIFDYISLDRSYLEKLESKTIYNGEVPVYDITYKLGDKDKNIQKIKEIYPDLPIDTNNINMTLAGDGIPWNTTSRVSLEIYLDDNHNNYFTSSLSFKGSGDFNNLIEGE
ncbi:Csa1 family protein [Clostridium sp. LP20]|uniref:Csa1 family protein n=1 Tax=Clostridium sp. LP20 TaxID=3418665 RepID=UPI003EE54D8A